MKNIYILIILLIWISGFAQINYTDTIFSGGTIRTFRVYVPAMYSQQTPRPLLFQFHGYGGDAISSEQGRFRNVADTANFILITPNGTIDPAYPQFGQGWNTYFCCFTVDDVLFVSDMIDSLKSQFNIDTTRIYATGFSNGGMMCYELGCKLGNKIAAIASVAGTMIASRLKACNPTKEVPVIEIHGTADPALPWNGLISGIDTFSAINSVIDFWVGTNQCTKTPSVVDLPDINTTDGSTVTKYLYENCFCHSSVELFKVNGGGHTAPGPGGNTNYDMDAVMEIWRFLRSHTLNCSSSSTDIPISFNWTLFPNPFGNEIEIDFQNRHYYKINIYDDIGRLIYSNNINEREHTLTIDSRNMKKGIYLVELTSDIQKTTKKIIKIE
jgi:polyhydroxybutyrate depolymerase